MKAIIGGAITVGLTVLLASASDAQELPRNVFAVSPDEEIEDLLFLGDTRPALIRLHIRVDGEGHRGRWREFVRPAAPRGRRGRRRGRGPIGGQQGDRSDQSAQDRQPQCGRGTFLVDSSWSPRKSSPSTTWRTR